MSQSIPIYIQPASARSLHSPAHSLYNHSNNHNNHHTNINNNIHNNHINSVNNSGSKSTYRSTSSTTRTKTTRQVNVNESFTDRDQKHEYDNNGDLSRSACTVAPMDYDSKQHQPVRSRAQDLSPIKPSFVK